MNMLWILTVVFMCVWQPKTRCTTALSQARLFNEQTRNTENCEHMLFRVTAKNLVHRFLELYPAVKWTCCEHWLWQPKTLCATVWSDTQELTNMMWTLLCMWQPKTRYAAARSQTQLFSEHAVNTDFYVVMCDSQRPGTLLPGAKPSCLVNMLWTLTFYVTAKDLVHCCQEPNPAV